MLAADQSCARARTRRLRRCCSGRREKRKAKEVGRCGRAEKRKKRYKMHGQPSIFQVNGRRHASAERPASTQSCLTRVAGHRRDMRRDRGRSARLARLTTLLDCRSKPGRASRSTGGRCRAMSSSREVGLEVWSRRMSYSVQQPNLRAGFSRSILHPSRPIIAFLFFSSAHAKQTRTKHKPN